MKPKATFLFLFIISLKSFGQLDEKINQIFSKQGPEFSGSLVVLKNGGVIYNKSIGYSNHDEQILASDTTIYGLASLGKVFTMVGILKLIDDGLLSLDDSLSDYVSGFTDHRVKMITIRQLLTHRSGFGHYWQNPMYLKNYNDFDTIDEYLSIIENDTLAFYPGGNYKYSNSGYIILGKVIEKVSGKTYYEFIKEEIFDEVQMPYSGFPLKKDQDERFATPYSNHEKRIPASPKGASDGGSFSSLLDMIKFINRLFYNQSLVSKESKSLLLNNFEENPSGYFELTGGFSGVSTALLHHPESGYSFIFLSNQDPEATDGFLSSLVEVLKDEYLSSNELIIKGTVIDKDSEEQLAYTNIGIINKGVGTASDEEGSFNITIPKTNVLDTLTFSALGYDILHVSVQELAAFRTNIIRLKEKVTSLDEVIVSGQFMMSTIKGTRRVSPLASGAYIGGKHPGASLITLIEIPKEPSYLKKVEVHITGNKKEKPFKLRLRIYSITAAGEPNQDLLSSNILVKSSIKEGWLSFNLEEYDLMLSDNIFVGVEWIEKPNNKVNKFTAYPRISSVSSKKVHSFARTTSLNRWNAIEIKPTYRVTLEF